MNNKTLTVLFFIFISSCSWTQVVKDSTKIDFNKKYQFKYKQIIIPTVLISYGVLAINNNQLQIFNNEIKEEVGEHIDEKTTIDDFSQYVPLTTSFALNTLGIKGEHNLNDKTIIATTSSLIMGMAVVGIKNSSNIERPDGTSLTSFPSGHTATAFMGAELLYQEYKNVSIWYGISGYIVATGTGVFRMLNNRHWLSDVVAGAGIGILSTKVGYWIFPSIKKIVSKSGTSSKTVFLPYYNGKVVGIGLVSQF